MEINFPELKQDGKSWIEESAGHHSREVRKNAMHRYSMVEFKQIKDKKKTLNTSKQKAVHLFLNRNQTDVLLSNSNTE